MINLFEAFKNKFKKKPFSARDAYMTAKYNLIETNEEMLMKFFKSTEDLIKDKATAGKYCAMVEVDVDLQSSVNEIVEYYKGMGFQVMKLSSKTMVNGEKLKNLHSTFIILVWNTLTEDPTLKVSKDDEEDDEMIVD